jgi:hypothetical protein
VDRTRAWANITSGLLIGGIAIGVLGLGFFIAVLYIH